MNHFNPSLVRKASMKLNFGFPMRKRTFTRIGSIWDVFFWELFKDEEIRKVSL